MARSPYVNPLIAVFPVLYYQVATCGTADFREESFSATGWIKARPKKRAGAPKTPAPQRWPYPHPEDIVCLTISIPSSPVTAGNTSISNMSPQSILICPNGAVLSTSMIAISLGESVSSQYSPTTFMPSGYCHCSRRAALSWRVAPGRTLSSATNNTIASFPRWLVVDSQGNIMGG